MAKLTDEQTKQIEKVTGFYFNEDTFSFESDDYYHGLPATFNIEENEWIIFYWTTNVWGTEIDNEIPFPEDLKEKINKILNSDEARANLISSKKKELMAFKLTDEQIFRIEEYTGMDLDNYADKYTFTNESYMLVVEDDIQPTYWEYFDEDQEEFDERDLPESWFEDIMEIVKEVK